MGTSYQLPEVTSVEVPLLVAFAYTWEYRLVSFPSASYILVIFNSPFSVVFGGRADVAPAVTVHRLFKVGKIEFFCETDGGQCNHKSKHQTKGEKTLFNFCHKS